jgi:DNA-binding CsgD family transcriptional regulator
MKQLEEFSALLHAVYGGATNASAWPDILASVSEWMGGEKGLLITATLVLEKGGFAYTYRIPQSSIALWSTRYASQNLWLRAMAERNLMGTGSIVVGTDLVTDEEMINSEFYQGLLAPDDIWQVLAGLVYGTDHPDIPFIGCCLFRGRQSTLLNDDDRHKMRLLLPHMSRALGVMFTLRDAELRIAASLHALNQVRTGILLLDDQGQVCFANTEAERIFRQEDGLRLKRGSRSLDTLYANDPTAHSRTRQALLSTLRMESAEVDHFAHAIRVPRLSGLPDYHIQVSALPENSPYQGINAPPRAIVFIKDGTHTTRPEAELLMRSYRLTPAEARSALALCDGGSLDAVADELHVGINTLKTHLKSVYHKMSVNSRAALTKLLVSLASH